MGNGEVSVAAATAVVDYDLFRDTTWQTVSYDRVVSSIAVCGSAAAGDTKVALFVDGEKVGEYYNTATGFPTADHDRALEIPVPAGARLSCIVTDAPATNPINVKIEWEE